MYCECGCGQVTNIIPKNDSRVGLVKGEHYRFIAGHNAGLNGNGKRNISGEWVNLNQNKHVCKCGCNGYIKIQKHHFWVGVPQYIHGHQTTTQEFRAERVKFNKEHLGELSNRWVEDRNTIRNKRGQNFQMPVRRQIYVRDEGICKSCGTFTLLDVGNQDPLKAHIDHIIAVKDGGTNDLLNGQVLCLICHKLKHSAIEKRPNSGKPKLEQSSMAIPNQAGDLISLGVRNDYGASAKAMI